MVGDENVLDALGLGNGALVHVMRDEFAELRFEVFLFDDHLFNVENVHTVDFLA